MTAFRLLATVALADGATKPAVVRQGNDQQREAAVPALLRLVR